MDYMVVEVSLERESFGQIKSVLATDKRRPDAEAIANMAVMRRGVESSFLDVRPMTARPAPAERFDDGTKAT